MARLDNQSKASKQSKWWALWFLVILLGCVLVQMPASWLVQKFLPSSPFIQQVSGNVWRGSVLWQAPSVAGQGRLTGSLDWQWQPWQLVLGKIGASVQVHSGTTDLSGQMRLGLGGWQVSKLSGRLGQDTLSALGRWQLPEAPISVNALSFGYQGKKGDKASVLSADGQLTWVGGDLGYPSGSQMLRIALPAMHAEIRNEKKGDQSFVKMDLLDNQNKRLGEFVVDNQLMLDVGLTQRLLEHMPSYSGQAPQDTMVVNVRQPLFSGLSMPNAHLDNANPTDAHD